MKPIVLKIFETIFDDVLLNQLIKKSPFPVIPFYHTVSDNEIPHIKYLYKHKNWNEFQDEINIFKELFKSADSIEELISKKNHFMLTFDDGMTECYNISKYLKKNHLKAIFFICPNFVDNKEMFYRHKVSLLLGVYKKSKYRDKAINKKICDLLNICNYADIPNSIFSVTYKQKDILDQIADILDVSFSQYLENNKPYLTSMEITEMLNDGFYFGAHSLDHPYFKILDMKDKRMQIIDSLSYIKKFNINYKYFAFPFSLDESQTSQNIVRELSGKYVDYTFSSHAFSKKNTATHFQRFTTENNNLPLNLFLQRSYLTNYYKSILSKLNLR